MKRVNIIISILILSVSFIFAQNDTSQVQNDVTPVQLTFLYPVGTNGYKAYEKTNLLSLNMLIGVNGGMQGMEIGGVGNVNNGDVEGMQLAGVFNINNGNVSGLQNSGTFNINKGNFQGIQATSIFNTNVGSFQGLQATGISNFNTDKGKGLFVSGVLNTNIKDIEGLQVAGVVNTTIGKTKGGQISGNLNISTDSLEGMQIGLFNYARHLKGFQLGLVNVTSVSNDKSIPVGLVNIVKGGWQELELSGSESVYANLNFKLGVRRFYTIYKCGYSSYNNNPVVSLGLGIGSNIKIKNKHSVSIDLSGNSLVYDMNFELPEDYSFLNKLDLTYRYALSDRFYLFAGPSFNVYQYSANSDNLNGTINVPYTIHKRSYTNMNVATWIGANAGISVEL